jgi:uncharacterized protein (TIGR03435 family)
MSMKYLLMAAYDVKVFQVAGPAWLDTERFEIDATMAPGTTKEQFRVMLQNLLAERFKLVVHQETTELPMYALVVDKNGPKMKESAAAPAVKSDDDPLPASMTMRPRIGADGFPVLYRVLADGIASAGGSAAWRPRRRLNPPEMAPFSPPPT